VETWFLPCLSCLIIGFLGGFLAAFMIYAKPGRGDE
jgi:hypothetical protein